MHKKHLSRKGKDGNYIPIAINNIIDQEVAL